MYNQNNDNTQVQIQRGVLSTSFEMLFPGKQIGNLHNMYFSVIISKQN